MSDDRHEDIAARLRAEAGARAPERLQADVMLRVRAEPRPHRIPRRRTYWRPLGSLAAAACLVGAAVLGISHLSLSGSASSPGGVAASAPQREAAGAGGGTTGFLGHGSASSNHVKALGPTALSDHKDVDGQALYGAAVKGVPRPLRAAVLGRLALESPLPKALGTLDLHRGHGSH